MDVYELLFKKMYLLGFPDKYEGYKMIYYFDDLQADLCYNGTVTDKIKKMWELLK